MIPGWGTKLPHVTQPKKKKSSGLRVEWVSGMCRDGVGSEVGTEGGEGS